MRPLRLSPYLAFLLWTFLGSFVSAQTTGFCSNNTNLVVDEVLKRKLIIANPDLLGINDNDWQESLVFFTGDNASPISLEDLGYDVNTIQVDCSQLASLPFNTWAYFDTPQPDLTALSTANDNLYHYFIVTTNNPSSLTVPYANPEGTNFYVIRVETIDELISMLSDSNITFIMEDSPITGASSTTDPYYNAFINSLPDCSNDSCGEGKTIVIIDSGIDPNEFELVEQLCFSSNRPIRKDREAEVSHLCGVNATLDTSSHSPDNPLEFYKSSSGYECHDCKHGNTVAQIVKEVAPHVKLIAVQIDSCCKWSSTQHTLIPFAYRSDVLRALNYGQYQWDHTHLVNMSLEILKAPFENFTQNLYKEPCDNEPDNHNPLGSYLRHFNQNNVFVLAASGNAGRSTKITWPGCGSGGITVGAFNYARSNDHATIVDIKAPSGDFLGAKATSWATALLTAATARCNEHRNLALEGQSGRHIGSLPDLCSYSNK